MNEDREVLHRLLGESAARVAVGGAPVEATMRRGRALRGRRRAVRVAAAVVAVCALGGGVWLGLGATDPKRGAAAAPPATSRPGWPTPPGGPVVVEPGRRVDLGLGIRVRLVAGGSYVTRAEPGVDRVKKVIDDHFAVGSVSFGAYGRAATNLYLGAYRGESPADRVTVTVNGRVLDARILTLAGEPGWSFYYVEGPIVHPVDSAAGPANVTKTAVDVYARDGRNLATSTAPPDIIPP